MRLATRASPRYLEDAEAVALMRWAHATPYAGRTVADVLVHVPNGGRRNKREAGRLKAMGVKRGYPDYTLDVMRPEEGTNRMLGGLKLELKASRALAGYTPSTTPEQLAELSRLTIAGYKAVRAYGWIEAATAICSYLGIGFNVLCERSS